jgi:3-methyladenine DNA glycosylase/8-oxoguanine DNA glycosylase
LRRADPRLVPIIDWAGPCRLVVERPVSLFSALGRAIVYQQLSGKAAATIFGRVCALYPGGPRGFTPTRVLATPEATLRAAGLSRNKLLALRDLAERIESRELPGLAMLRRCGDDEIVAALTEVRGVGRWTAEMFLMFRLGRLDVLAVDDLGLRQGHAILAGRDGESARDVLAGEAERWRPYRSIASWYLWRAVDRRRQQVQQAQQ